MVAGRVALLLASVAAVVWLGLGLRSAVLHERARQVQERLSGPDDARRAVSLLQRARRHRPDAELVLAEATLLLYLGEQRPRVEALAREVARQEPENIGAWALLFRANRDLDPLEAGRAQARMRELNPRR